MIAWKQCIYIHFEPLKDKIFAIQPHVFNIIPELRPILFNAHPCQHPYYLVYWKICENFDVDN
jgi:hypothetical protein